MATDVTLPKAVIAQLLASGASTMPHGNRLLIQHLIGTYGLLHQWACPQSTCYAGLFHSVFGTTHYDLHSETLSRKALAATVGTEAVALIEQFSRITTFDLLHSMPGPRVTDQWIELLHIAAGNLVEQWPFLESELRVKIATRDREQWRDKLSLLRPPCGNSLLQILSSELDR